MKSVDIGAALFEFLIISFKIILSGIASKICVCHGSWLSGQLAAKCYQGLNLGSGVGVKWNRDLICIIWTIIEEPLTQEMSKLVTIGSNHFMQYNFNSTEIFNDISWIHFSEH